MGCQRLAVHERKGPKAKLARFPLFPPGLGVRGRAAIIRPVNCSARAESQGLDRGCLVKGLVAFPWASELN